MVEPLPRARVLEVDRGLTEEIDPASVDHAVRSCVTPILWLRRGRWRPRVSGRQSFGLLVLDGLIVRRLRVGSRCAAELLGPGDLLRPWIADLSCIPATVSWRVERDATLAELDRGFLEASARWPAIQVALSDRAFNRQRSLVLRLAIAQEPVAERLRLLFWHLADRWGQRELGGMVMPLRLTQKLLSELVSSQRRSVARALSELEERNVIRRRGQGGWLLLDRPPTRCHRKR